MKNVKRYFLKYVLKGRRSPSENRERVGKNLMLLAIAIFFAFFVNFAVIIGTDKKFGVSLSEGARNVHQMTRTVQAKRGTIYDRDGNPIAEDSTTYNVYAIIDESYVSATQEKLYVQPEQYATVANIFNDYLDIDENYVKSQLSQKNLTQVSFGHKGNGITYGVMKDMSESLEEAGIKGVAFDTSPGRMYVNGMFASDFMGLAQLTENEDGSKSLVGQTGLEAAMNSTLSGTDGKVTYQKDKNGNILLGTAKTVQKVKDGKDVYTTISAPIQTFLETQMNVFDEKTKGVHASATLVKAKTGEILATTQRPSFNSDTKKGLEADNFIWRNQLYQASFEPGSTMKVMLLSSAIDAGVFKPNEVYDNTSLTIGDATIKDWLVNQGLGTGGYLTYAQGFALSSNIGMTKLEQAMGQDKWLNYLGKFRFGFPTRFGMDSEEFGLLPADNIVSIAMSSFGQGISVTEVQMLRGFLAVANDGVMLEPQFISQIYDNNTKTSRVARREVVGHPVSRKAAKDTREYMITVGTDPLFGTLQVGGVPIIQVGNESVAVKSGTAQIADKSGYLEGENDYIYSVVAMVPAEDPEFIMYVTLQQPETKFDGLLWQDIVNPILEEAMFMRDSLDEPMLNTKKNQTVYKMPDVLGDSPGNVAAELRRQVVQPIVLGTGTKISKVSVEAGEKVAENQQILILSNTLTTVPDMYGWTKKNVKTFAEWTGIDVKIKGKGRVVRQSKDTGTALKGLKKLTITLGEE